VPVFSFLGTPDAPAPVPCWITHTNERTHEIIRSGFDRSPMFTGVIGAWGHATARASRTRSTVSPTRLSHQIFLEPEGLTTHEFYPNGISTSLPFDVQIAAVQLDGGAGNGAHPAARLCHRIRLLRPARAEAELRDPAMPGLFFAGQINGTTGYEEAAAQGLFAGANAALQVQGSRALDCRGATRPTWACWSTTSSPRA
jgi:tRNA uridine 5-carboxymethylaminomethyl modification enzyme